MMFGQIFAFRGKRDHSPLVEFTDLDALGQVAVLVEEPAHARADFAQLLAEPAMGNLEAAMFGRRCRALFAASAPNSRSSLARSVRRANLLI
jgi:hypothetical protein